ncbi:hypothetical protein [Streptomyces olivaceus]
MTDTPPPRSGTGRVPDWWRAKTPALPGEEAPRQDPEPNDPAPEDGWWDALYGTDAPSSEPEDVPQTEDAPATETAGTGWFTPQPGYYPHPSPPAVLTQAPDRIAISARTRAALYNASAAGAGWALGLYDPCAWALADCGSYSTGGALVLGVGAALLVAHLWDRRTRHWWPGLAWAARIPLATVILAVALWAPAAS